MPENMILTRPEADASAAPTAESPVEAADTSDELTSVLIIVGVVAVVLVIVTVVLLLCLRKLRHRRRKRTSLAARYDNIFTTLRRPSPVAIVDTRRQLSEPSAYHSTYNTFDIVTEYQQELGGSGRYLETGRDSRTSRKSSDIGGEKLTKVHSVDMGSTSMGIKKKVLKKSMSNPVLTSKCESEPEKGPSISFTLKYDSKSRQLRMKLLSIADLPQKCYGYEVSVVVYLFPRNVDGMHSRTVTGAREVTFNENFLIDDLTVAEVEKSTMRFLLQYRKKSRSSKEDFLGEMNMKCCDYDWATSETLNFTAMPLGSKQRKGTPDKYLLEELGSLFVCLEYKAGATRIKVMVRKATNLPKSDKLIGDPGHYVIINLQKNDQVVKTKETKTSNGYNPIWNQPFLFDLSDSPETVYSLDFVIMRKKLHTKDAVIGHVAIGENGCRSGRSHWKEIMSPRPLETAKWHSIAPVLGKTTAQCSFDSPSPEW
ncbi:synaptotagmin-1-like [Mya arenaria]|nr:synaptotagmin-1-like [Mya arenaria]